MESFLAALAGGAAPPALECVLAGRGGREVDAVLSASPLRLGDREGAILTVKDVSSWRRSAGGGGGTALSALWQATEVALFRATWGRRTFITDANPSARRMFGIEEGGSPVNLFALLADPHDAERLYADLGATGSVRERQLHLARPDGASLTVWLSAALARGADGEVLHLEGLARDVTEAGRREQRREELIDELETSSLFLGRPVQTLARTVPTVALDCPIRAVASRLGREGSDCALVSGPGGEPLGMVTDRDLRERVVAAGADPQGPVREIMSSPLAWLPGTALVYEAVLEMRARRLNHLLVRDPAGGAAGGRRASDLLQLARQAPAVLGRELASAGTLEQVGEARGQLLELVRGLQAGGAGPRSVLRIFNAASDRVVQKLLQLARLELGEPPASFAFLALGGAGRQELVPGSDQDNALIFSTEEEAEQVRPYFLALGARVCGWLEELGVPPCPGGVMACNPSWCASLPEWEDHFTRWVRLPEAQELLDFNIFFDLRAAGGNGELVQRLRGPIAGLLAENPPFFLLHARDALQRRLPALPKSGPLALKQAIAPLVSFARNNALRHGVAATNTWERLEELRGQGVLDGRLFRELTRSYTLLLRLRLAAQLEGRGNLVEPAALPEQEQALLKESLAQSGRLAKRISFDFLGSAL